MADRPLDDHTYQIAWQTFENCAATENNLRAMCAAIDAVLPRIRDQVARETAASRTEIG